MKNMKVRTKLNLILVLVILLVALGGTVSVKDMEDVKDKALETMEASSRQSYDDSIKEQVEVVISLLSEINDAYKAGTYTLDDTPQKTFSGEPIKVPDWAVKSYLSEDTKG